MSKKKNSSVHLVKMVQHCMRISRYLARTKLEEFIKRDLNYDAILKQVDLLGESVSQLSNNDPDGVMKHFPLIPWSEMRALRNRSAHDYFTIDPKIVWDYINSSLPKVESEIRTILEQRYRIVTIEDYLP